jgi:limonene 1,2-monooxygenase
LKSWDLVMRYVVPELNGFLEPYRSSREHVVTHRDVFERAGQAVLSKIMENEKAAQALQESMAGGRMAIPAHNAPDLTKPHGKAPARKKAKSKA